MPDKTITDDAVIDAFRSCLTGHLIRGITHNLNGMFQILSMQLELLRRELAQDKRKIDGLFSHGSQSPDIQDATLALLQDLRGALAKKDGRAMESQGVLMSLEDMSGMIAGRGQGAKGLALVKIDKALREELEFLKADLFFKHQVTTVLDAPSLPLTILIDERLFKDLIDVVMTMCINQLKPLEKSDKKEIKIVLKNGGSQFKLDFEHTGRPFNLNEDGEDNGPMECVRLQDDVVIEYFVTPFAALLKLIAGKLNAALEISPQKIGFVFAAAI
jgi:hypothetical protein